MSTPTYSKNALAAADLFRQTLQHAAGAFEGQQVKTQRLTRATMATIDKIGAAKVKKGVTSGIGITVKKLNVKAVPAAYTTVGNATSTKTRKEIKDPDDYDIIEESETDEIDGFIMIEDELAIGDFELIERELS